MLDWPKNVCAGQVQPEYPATFVLFSKCSLGAQLLRGRPKSVASQASELGQRENGITPFDCSRDKCSLGASRAIAAPPLATTGYGPFTPFLRSS
jgi:hypothetical protein